MRFLILLLASLSCVYAHANVRYTYEGNPFAVIEDIPFPAGTFDTSMRVSGFFELASPLAPNLTTDISADVVDFSFSNGRNTLTAQDPNLSALFFVQTDASGQISIWDVILQQALTLTPLGDHDTTISTQNDDTGLFGISGVQDRGVLLMCDPANVPRGLCISFADTATIDNAPGAWSSDVDNNTVDEPAAAMAIVAFGFCAGVVTRRHRRRSDAIIARAGV